ncbi:MAG: hypothetical protein M3Q29_11825 [Chloroflexota bacterium]|nr:hypothetical protein [Chloroflexota bacterium]
MTTTDRRRDIAVPSNQSTSVPSSHLPPSWLITATVAGSLALYFVLFLLLRGKSFRLTQTATLYRWPSLGRLSDLLTPESLVTSSWTSEQAGVHEYVYLLVAAALVALWVLALWLVRPGGRTLSLKWILIPIGLFSIPLFVLPGMFSGDIYLYMFYGRIIARYAQNPILVPPDAFTGDPHLRWTYWTWLPSSYGPVWLMLSGALSAIAGQALWANLFTYKAGVLVIHLLATVVVWKLLRYARPELASWGAVFYGWNPLVLFETVGSGHNDVLVGLFTVLALLAVVYNRWLYGVFFLVAAAMVKLMALVLLPVLILAWLRGLPTHEQRLRAGASAAAVAVGGGLLLYAPLWGGTALFTNIRDNPAAREYQNSLWELFILKVTRPGFDPMYAVFSPDLDLFRNLAFVGVYFFLLWRLWKGQEMMDTMTWVWFAYFLFAAWFWPWYVLQLIPIAAVRGPGRAAAIAGGLTLGGMLFWLGWPEPALPATPYFFNYRSVLMFAPAIVLALWPLRGLGRARGAARQPLEVGA